MRAGALFHSAAARRVPVHSPRGRSPAGILLACLCLIRVPGGAEEPNERSGPGFRSATLQVPVGPTAGFTLLAPEETGVAFTNRVSDRTIAHNRIYENGSGVALGDVDGDGRCDIYLCQLEGPNALYRNLGDWRFSNITAEAGVACPDQASTGAAFADVDGDGDLDLLVNGIGSGTHLYLNDGHARFSELTGTRLVRRFGSTSMSLADIDGDGDLDLYVANYRTDTYRDRPPGLKVEARKVGGRIVVSPEGRFLPVIPQEGAVEVVELGERDFLYLNDGSGRFAPVSWTAGSFVDEEGQALAAPPLDWGLAVLLRDLNHDRAPDIFVCNDFFLSPDRLWLNENSRRFRAAPHATLRHISLASMAMDVADINRDGADDLLVADMISRHPRDRQRQRPDMMQGRFHPPIEDPDYRPEVPHNTLFLNRGDGTYAEIAQLSGLAATEWTWNLAFLDVDLDGYDDLLVANGNHHDVQDADTIHQIDLVRDRESPEARLARFPALHTANLAFRNRGDLTFEDQSTAWGFDLQGASQGMALADLDGDGDLDVVLNNLNAGASLYRNESSAPRVAVRLRGSRPNTQGIGARIELFGGPVPVQGQEVVCGGRYTSADDTLKVFAAAPPAAGSLRLEVTWRDGRRSQVRGVQPNHLYEIDASAASPGVPNRPGPTEKPPFFEEVSSRLGHTHLDRPFDDLARQPLLSHRWDRLGPGVAWVESDAQSLPNLVVGTGAGGRLACFQNDGHGAFTRIESEIATRDQLGLAVWSPSPTNAVVLVASANYEDPSSGPSKVLAWAPTTGTTTNLGPALDASSGPLALADFDGDGDLDLFLGGRIAAGRFPEPVSSTLFLQDHGTWTADRHRSACLSKIGLVSGAVFGDIDADGDPDLVLACHWGPVRILRNDAGQFHDITSATGLDPFRGWWNGVTTGDFDGDGRLDIVASNWGRNTRYQAALGKPVEVAYQDFDGNGTIEPIESFVDPDTGHTVPWQDFETLSRCLPFVRGQVASFRAYGESDLRGILGPQAKGLAVLGIDTLDSMVFLNRGDHFEPVPLPVEAQFAPAFGIAVCDFDGDGNEDIFLAQNFFDVADAISRYDAGVGLWLEGDGRGGFRPVPPTESGIHLSGEQRGCAVADFDGDGRPDLAVGQNHGTTALFRNRRGRPGVRVRLRGPPGNPTAVGAVLRVRFENRWGAAREIHAGSGYASQDAFTQALATPDRPVALQIRWPGGIQTDTAIQPGSREVSAQAPLQKP